MSIAKIVKPGVTPFLIKAALCLPGLEKNGATVVRNRCARLQEDTRLLENQLYSESLLQKESESLRQRPPIALLTSLLNEKSCQNWFE